MDDNVKMLYHSIKAVMYKDYVLVHESDRIIKYGWCHTEGNVKHYMLDDAIALDNFLHNERRLQYDVNIIANGMQALENEDIHHVVIEFKDRQLLKAVTVELDDFAIETSLI